MRISIILAGGLGTRMQPITNTLNKALIPVDGEASLGILLRQLDELGESDALVLAGYLGNQVAPLVERIKFRNLKVKVIVSSPELTPQERIIASYEDWKNSKELVLQYCDNVFNSEILHRIFSSLVENLVFLQARSPGNAQLDDFGFVKYLSNRNADNPYVELGYWRVPTENFARAIFSCESLESTLKRLTTEISISPVIVSDYRSNSNIARYISQRNNRKTVFLDRDGVLIESVKEGQYVTRIDEVRFHEPNLKLLENFSKQYCVDYIVVTNQACVERGICSMQEVTEVNRYISSQLLSRSVPILAFYVCPHHWKSGCLCRKPNPGMLIQALQDFSLNERECLMIGDTNIDILAGERAGVHSILLEESLDITERRRVLHEAFRHLEC